MESPHYWKDLHVRKSLLTLLFVLQLSKCLRFHVQLTARPWARHLTLASVSSAKSRGGLNDLWDLLLGRFFGSVYHHRKHWEVTRTVGILILSSKHEDSSKGSSEAAALSMVDCCYYLICSSIPRGSQLLLFQLSMRPCRFWELRGYAESLLSKQRAFLFGLHAFYFLLPWV